MNPAQGEPSWTELSWQGRSAFSRPLLGSELLADQFSRLQDGATDCIMGFTCKTPLSLAELRPILLEAYARLRFMCPIIATSIHEGIHDPELRSWVYSLARDAQAVKDWAQESVIIDPTPADPGNFINLTGARLLPYVLADGTHQYVRCFLFPVLGSEGVFAIFLHGPHSIMDAGPTMRAFSLLVNEMSKSAPDALDTLAWGTEWSNLPAGPVIASGGPRPNWEDEALPLIGKIATIHANPVPTHGLEPQRRDITVRSRRISVLVDLSAPESAKMLREVKAAGFSLTHLFDAAQALAIFACNPVSEEAAPLAHVTNSLGMISTARYRVPPYNGKSQFISEMTIVPLQVKFREVPPVTHDVSPKSRLVRVMEIVKAQYDEYLKNPHLPHLLAVQMKIAPPRTPVVSSNPYASIMTNIGVVERNLPTTWFQDGDKSKQPRFEILSLPFGHRVSVPSPTTHVWSMHSKIHVQIEATDIWDREYLQSYADEIVRQALKIADGAE